MEFYPINLLYLAIWVFNVMAFMVARSINDFYCEDQKQNKFIQYLFNHQCTIANVLKMVPILLVFGSFVLVIVSMGSSLETTQWMIALYFVVTMINLLVNGLGMTLFKRN